MIAAVIAVVLLEVRVQFGSVCPKTGVGMCSMVHIEPLWQWITEHLRSVWT